MRLERWPLVKPNGFFSPVSRVLQATFAHFWQGRLVDLLGNWHWHVFTFLKEGFPLHFKIHNYGLCRTCRAQKRREALNLMPVSFLCWSGSLLVFLQVCCLHLLRQSQALFFRGSISAPIENKFKALLHVWIFGCTGIVQMCRQSALAECMKPEKF